MALYMNRIIDFDLSKTEGKFTVKPGVDAELDMSIYTAGIGHSLIFFYFTATLLFVRKCNLTD